MIFVDCQNPQRLPSRLLLLSMNNSLTVRFCLLMFFQFFIWGVWYVPMWSYLGTLKVEASLRGTAYAATGVAAMISP